jgi:hypothetical protein
MTQKTLNTDALLLEPPRIVAPDGSNAILIDYTQEDVVRLVRTLQELQSAPQSTIPLKLADLLVGLCVDPIVGARVIDQLPLPRLMDVIGWLQTAETSAFIAPSAPDGEVTIQGQTYAIRILSVGMLRRTAALETAEPGDLADMVGRNAEVMVSMIDGLTLDEWQKLPRRQTAAVERYFAELMQEQATAAAPAADPKPKRVNQR